MNKQILVLIVLISGIGFSFAQSGVPKILNSRCLGGSSVDKANDVLPLADGGYIIVGETNSNDGDVSGLHGSQGNADGWVVRVSNSGNILWQKAIGGDNKDVFNSIVATLDNQFLCFGTTASTNGDVSGNLGQQDFWAVKITQQGSIVWSKNFGGLSVDQLTDGIATADSGFAMIGRTFSVNSGQVSGFHGTSGSDIWLVKISANGSIGWQKCYGNANGAEEWPGDVIEDNDLNLVAIAHAYGIENDFPSFNNFNQYTFKVDKNNGNFIYNVRTGGRNSSDGSLIPISNGFLTASKYVSTYYNPQWYTFSSFVNLTSGIPTASPALEMSTPALSTGPFGDIQYGSFFAGAHGIAALSDSAFAGVGILYDKGSGPTSGIYGGAYDALVGFGKFSGSGNSFGLKNFGGTGEDNFTAIKKLNNANEFIAVGFTNSNDNDVSGNNGSFDCWVVKIRVPYLANVVKGRVFVDKNSNGMKDATEVFLNNARVNSETDGFSSVSQTTNGVFENFVDTGSYTTSIQFSKPYYVANPTSKTSYFATHHLKDSFDFAVQPVPGKKDLRVSLIPLSAARPGYSAKYLIKYENMGTENLSPVLRLVKDARTTLVSASTTPSSQISDTITWLLPVMESEATATIELVFQVPAPPGVSLADVLRFDLDATPLIGDETPFDNSTSLNQVVSGSFDPNDKLENHAGVYTLQQLASREKLNYTIRFQNTGTDTAFKVRITDTLSEKLDPTTIETIGASHSYRFSLVQGKYCTWTFDKILLPDSNRNEPLSHGYISFHINPKQSVGLADTIKNTASIYFDYNLPVQTNIQITVVKPTSISAPNQPVVTGLLSEYCNNLGIQKGKITNLPSSGSGVTVTVKLDANNLVIGPDSSFSFVVNSLTAGAHTITVSFTNASGIKTTTHNFTVIAVISPDVNVGSNISTIVNLVDQVVVTANNAAGGGTGPLYTFGKDRNFANLWQAESGSAVLSLNPSSLSLGDNWIYVRMKSNATCVSSTLATDSIKLIRSMVTGISDPENPGKVISLYPNPFNRQIFIKGLSASKTYTIVVSNLSGQVLMQKRIANRNNTELELQPFLSGNYLLSIYDEKRQRLLGTLPITKQ